MAAAGRETRTHWSASQWRNRGRKPAARRARNPPKYRADPTPESGRQSTGRGSRSHAPPPAERPRQVRSHGLRHPTAGVRLVRSGIRICASRQSIHQRSFPSAPRRAPRGRQRKQPGRNRAGLRRCGRLGFRALCRAVRNKPRSTRTRRRKLPGTPSTATSSSWRNWARTTPTRWAGGRRFFCTGCTSTRRGRITSRLRAATADGGALRWAEITAATTTPGPRGAAPLIGNPGFEAAGEGSVFLRDIRHHDDHSPLNPQSLEGDYLPIELPDLRRETLVPAPWTQPQARFAAGRQRIRIIKGSPGSGKTTALWHAADLAGRNAVLYVTYSNELAALAREHFDRF